jgi:uncharacterized membrane protein YkgB
MSRMLTVVGIVLMTGSFLLTTPKMVTAQASGGEPLGSGQVSLKLPAQIPA